MICFHNYWHLTNLFILGGKSIKDELKLSDLDLSEGNRLYFKDLGMYI